MGHRPPVALDPAGGGHESSVLWNASRSVSSRAGGGSGGGAPATKVDPSPPRMWVPSQPSSSASTGPKQAPTRMQIAAPENQVTSDRPMPKKPNWASFSSHDPGHPHRRRDGVQAGRDGGEQPGGEQHPGPHVAEQQVPGREPPHAGRHHEPHQATTPTPNPPSAASAAAPRAAMPASTRARRRRRARTCRPPRQGGRRHARRYVRWRAVDERGSEEQHQEAAPASWSRRGARRTTRTPRGRDPGCRPAGPAGT